MRGEITFRSLAGKPELVLVAKKAVCDEVFKDLFHGKEKREIRMASGECGQPVAKKKHAYPLHDRTVVAHGAVHTMLSPVGMRVLRLRHIGERCC